jgi:hypothetical protein
VFGFYAYITHDIWRGVSNPVKQTPVAATRLDIGGKLEEEQVVANLVHALDSLPFPSIPLFNSLPAYGGA